MIDPMENYWCTPKIEEIYKLIDQFLEDGFKSSDGGFAKVDKKEISALHEIIELILRAKYERDPDGDLPIRTYLVDRTKLQDHMIWYLRGSRKSFDEPIDSEAIESQLRAINYAVSVANSLSKTVEYEVRELLKEKR